MGAFYLGPEIPHALLQLTQIHPNILPYQLDVTDFKRMKQLAQELKNTPIDLPTNNAGILDTAPFGHLDPSTLEKVYRTNAVAPLLMCEAFHPLLKSQKGAIICISSKKASLKGDVTENMIAYRMSKVALNMAVQEVARKLAPLDIQVLLIAPGHVKTDMSPHATLLPPESVHLVRQAIQNCAHLRTEGFYDHFGKPIEW